MKRVSVIFLPFLTVASAYALDLSTPFDLGNNLLHYTSPNGDTTDRNAPTLVDVADPILSQAASDLSSYYTVNATMMPNITQGSALAGEARVRKQEPNSSLELGTGRYFMGNAFQIDYVGSDQADLRWLVYYSYSAPGSDAPWIFTSGFSSDTDFYYHSSVEADYHDGLTDTYMLDSNIYSLGAIGDSVWKIWALPTTVLYDANGTVTDITLHDGVLLSSNVTQVEAVPEPASMLALGLFALPLLRRRK